MDGIDRKIGEVDRKILVDMVFLAIGIICWLLLG